MPTPTYYSPYFDGHNQYYTAATKKCPTSPTLQRVHSSLSLELEKTYKLTEKLLYTTTHWPKVLLGFMAAYLVFFILLPRLTRGRDLSKLSAAGKLAFCAFSLYGFMQTLEPLHHATFTATFYDSVCSRHGSGPTLLLTAMNHLVRAIVFLYEALTALQYWPSFLPTALITLIKVIHVSFGTSLLTISHFYHHEDFCDAHYQNLITYAITYMAYGFMVIGAAVKAITGSIAWLSMAIKGGSSVAATAPPMDKSKKEDEEPKNGGSKVAEEATTSKTNESEGLRKRVSKVVADDTAAAS